MQALKSLVVGLGMLIVLSFGLLIYGFYSKLTGLGDEAPAAGAEAAVDGTVAQAPIAGFGEVRVALPSGCVVTDMRPDGAGRLYLRLDYGGETVAAAGATQPIDCNKILVVDVATGRQLGVLTLVP